MRELHALEDNYKAIQTENYSLREYIIHLQSRLIESHGEYPQPPANVNLNHPRDPLDQQQQQQLHRHHDAPTAPMAVQAMNQLQASAAQAVADLSNNNNNSKRSHHDDNAYLNAAAAAAAGPPKRFKDAHAHDAADPSEELSRQLQASADGMPAAMAM